VQYPGVADSIQSDLALVKPIALRMFNMSAKDSEKYFKEVEYKLLEETDYRIELEQSREITEACAHLQHIHFPKYYDALSSQRVLTMSYVEGVPLGQWVKTSFSAKEANAIGQALWDFYMYQIHGLKKVHADPHPGNFLIDQNNELVVIDFGCIKVIPDSFYTPYFELAKHTTQDNEQAFTEKLYELEMLVPSDGPREVAYFSKLFRDLLTLFTAPFNADTFDFSDPKFWEGIGKTAEFFANDQEIRKMNSNRGSQHFLYMNRTFFGLYNLLYDLKAKVDTQAFRRYL
jgi:predicted unusual protein kinase regulating ubiquinone biosynthesis (AarF/ABC1/UbiB family)